MKFDEMDRAMRVYETANDYCVPPEIYMAARIDGRNFTRLTKETCRFEAPYDEKFRDYMVETVRHLMTCGFNAVYGYTQSDEISLLFSLDELAFSRKMRKYNSILAGEASAKFSLLIGIAAVFDCRISTLPNGEQVVNYFRWRNEDACRNALNSHCYWLLRGQGESAARATSFLSGMSVAQKNEFLFRNGVNFNDLPNWHKRGIGVYWQNVEKKGVNPVTGESAATLRRQLKVDCDLPMKEDYEVFLRRFL